MIITLAYVMMESSCVRCKTFFAKTHPRRIYCSALCRIKAYEERHPTARTDAIRKYRKTAKGKIKNKEYAKKWRTKNPERARQLSHTSYWEAPEHSRSIARRSYWKRRIELILLLGGKCINCGISDIRILQVNHINGNGRKELKNPARLYRAIIAKIVPQIGRA